MVERQNQSDRGRPVARVAFTLMELLVVIAIIAVVAAASIPIVNSLMHGNRVKQAENMVNAYLAGARATALSTRNPVAVVFFTDHNPALSRPMMAAQLVGQVPFPANLIEAHFSALPDHPVEHLPDGVDVVTLGDLSGDLQGPNSMFPCRAVLFGADGQLLVRNALVGDNPDWNMNGLQPTPLNGNVSMDNGTSSPGVIVYDAATLASKGLSGAAAEDWIMKNGNVMVLNSYTGNVLR